MIRRFASAALFLLFAVAAARAETISASVPMSPSNEITPNPPIVQPGATGAFQITVNVTRDGAGAITGGAIRFLGNVAFPQAITTVGLHIHEGAATINGPVRFDTGLSAANPVAFATGKGVVDLTVTITATNLEAFKRFIANPAGFYVNLHTTENPGGAIRGQILKLEEAVAITVNMSTANEVPPITTATASGVATILVTPVRNPTTGALIGGNVTFSMSYDLPVNSTIVGLHIHRGDAGVNGPVVINTGINSTTNAITLPTGKGSLAITSAANTTLSFEAMRDLLANPSGFYVNLHTSDFPNGIIRSQLTAPAAPPVIQAASTYFLPTGATDATVTLTLTGVDLTSSVLINGTPATVTPDLVAGTAALTVPAALLATEGTLWVQARNGAGLLSNLVGIVVATNPNTFPLTTVDAAKFGPTVAPDSIASIFGTDLASTFVQGATVPLPVQLDGTKVYVNGVLAPLFAVSPLQANIAIPFGTLPGPASVVITNKNGLVSRGVVTVTPSSPAIFTSSGNGTGAPAAVATKDGVTFTFLGNPDGSPVPVDAGSVAVLFGTGFRYNSTGATVTIGGDPGTVAFIGPQGTLAAVDQINIPIPASLAGKGAVDLILTVDGKAANTVKLIIK